MMLPNGATVAVADGETLSLFRNGGHEGGLALKAIEAPALDGSDVGTSHRSSEAEPDDKTQTEDGYAAASAAWLNKQVLEGKIGPLMVIAAPRTLGELRKHYHKQLEAVLVGELAKDLVGRPVAEIEAAVANA
jgi:protein required for attachment to host cells